MIATASLMRMGALMAGFGVYAFVIEAHGVAMYIGLYSCLALVALLLTTAPFVARRKRCAQTPLARGIDRTELTGSERAAFDKITAQLRKEDIRGN